MKRDFSTPHHHDERKVVPHRACVHVWREVAIRNQVCDVCGARCVRDNHGRLIAFDGAPAIVVPGVRL